MNFHNIPIEFRQTTKDIVCNNSPQPPTPAISLSPPLQHEVAVVVKESSDVLLLKSDMADILNQGKMRMEGF